MKTIGLLFTFFIAQSCLAQINLTKIDKKSIPQSIKYAGKPVEAVRYTDNAGDNLVILTETDIIDSKRSHNEGLNEKSLYAYHYVLTGGSYKQTWKVYDFVDECQTDIIAHFVDKTFAVTDLNKDGKAEVWLMYKVSCQGGVDVVPMKIIMYHDNKKYAARGDTKIILPEGEYGGEYTFDDAFKNGPAVFRQYAAKLWEHNKM